MCGQPCQHRDRRQKICRHHVAGGDADQPLDRLRLPGRGQRNATRKIAKKALFSTLWLFAFLNIIFRDIHKFTTAAAVNEILTGVTNGT